MRRRHECQKMRMHCSQPTATKERIKRRTSPCAKSRSVSTWEQSASVKMLQRNRIDTPVQVKLPHQRRNRNMVWLEKKPRNAPEELSSKRQVKSGVIVTALPTFNVQKKRRDPRFDPLCGDFHPHHFHSHYSWMSDEKQKEMQEWQHELKSGRRNKRPLTDEEYEELQQNIQRAKQSLAQTTREKGEQGLLRDWKHIERLAQKNGKRPFYLKESEKKKLALASRYLELKENKGALQKFMEKKTKKIKDKDHKYMPREGREE